MAGCKPAESLLAEREQERECGAGVSQNAGLERVDTRVLRFYWLLCCCTGSVLGATCCWLPLLHLMEARLEFISPAAGCIIALALMHSGFLQFAVVAGTAHTHNLAITNPVGL